MEINSCEEGCAKIISVEEAQSGILTQSSAYRRPFKAFFEAFNQYFNPDTGFFYNSCFEIDKSGPDFYDYYLIGKAKSDERIEGTLRARICYLGIHDQFIKIGLGYDGNDAGFKPEPSRRQKKSLLQRLKRTPNIILVPPFPLKNKQYGAEILYCRPISKEVNDERLEGLASELHLSAQELVDATRFNR